MMTTPEKQERLRRFLAERETVPIPRNYGKLVKLLALEFAQGIHLNLWRPEIILVRQNEPHRPDQAILRQFIEERWKDSIDSTFTIVLLAHGYIAATQYETRYRVTEKAMDLLEYPDPHDVFISYRRLDSSALALLVLARLKEHSLVPFCDMALEAGGNWHADLEDRIRDCDYFIILLGKDTLSSPMTVKEIQWALEYEKTVIPVWHSGFDIDSDQWNHVPSKVIDAIQQTNAIIVQDESASGYNSAIVELLNRFGITP